MELDPIFLSRLQFAFVVSFHAIFPVITIGLAAYIALLETLHFRTNNPVYLKLAQFWVKIFAVLFGMGVVTGIVMAFQFGTNWSNFSLAASNFLGPVLAYEVITAFFLEATFLGVLLFGRDKVSRGMYLFAAWMVALGALLSSFWILSAVSWMHTPAGIDMVDGMVHVTSWLQAIFNPSFPYRLGHKVLASFITGGIVVAGVSAMYLRQGRNIETSKKALKMCVILLAVISPLQLFMGHEHGLNTFEYQPVKMAAMEGIWETKAGAPLILFAIPDAANERNLFEISIPYLASILLTKSPSGVVTGLLEVPADERPPVGIVFWSFRVMVGLGMIFIGVYLFAAWRLYRDRLYESRRLLQVFTWLIPTPFIAVLAGWFVTEVGRQPWMMQGIMRLDAAVTPALTGGMALATLIGYVVLYAAVFGIGLFYLGQLINAGPDPVEGAMDSASAPPKYPTSTDDDLQAGRT